MALAVLVSATLLTLVLGVGESFPVIVELLGLLSLGAGAFFLRARLARTPAPSGLEVSFATPGILALGAATILGGHAGAFLPGEMRLGLVRLLALLAAAGLCLAFFAPRLFRKETGAREEDGPAPRPGGDLVLVLSAGFLFHAFVFFSYPPLVGQDSSSNLMEPRFLQYSPGRTFHHPPLYVEIVASLGGQGSNLVLGFTALVLIQHALVLGLAVLAQRMVRTVTRSRSAGALTGLAIALDPQLTLYSQAVLSEALAIAALVFAVALVFEATRRRPSCSWLLASGVAAASSTLIRQVSELWCFVVALWLLASGLVQPRFRAASIFLAGALVPLVLVVLHNAVFTERPSLTSATGRNLLYRALDDMPPLTDPAAPPGDPLERVRRLVWENRATTWHGPYKALQKEGWSDAEIDHVFTRFYFEQARRYPGTFALVTLRYAWVMLSVPETYASVAAGHNAMRSNPLVSWGELPPAGETPGLVLALAVFELPVRLTLVFLTLVAPFVTRGRARALVLLAIGTAFYFLVIAALTNQPILRYRLPALPFFAIGAGIAIGRLQELVRRRAPGEGS